MITESLRSDLQISYDALVKIENIRKIAQIVDIIERTAVAERKKRSEIEAALDGRHQSSERPVAEIRNSRQRRNTRITSARPLHPPLSRSV